MAQFYADTISQHSDVDAYVDATRLRFHESTQADRLAAHRMADKLRGSGSPSPEQARILNALPPAKASAKWAEMRGRR